MRIASFFFRLISLVMRIASFFHIIIVGITSIQFFFFLINFFGFGLLYFFGFRLLSVFLVLVRTFLVHFLGSSFNRLGFIRLIGNFFLQVYKILFKCLPHFLINVVLLLVRQL